MSEGHVEIRPGIREGTCYVVPVGGNGEPLSVTEVLESDGSAHVNIEAQRKAFNSGDVRDRR
jgi:hypothetical protein